MASNGLSIFGDHSDVMAARATGWAMLFANSVQEAMDFALIAQASTLEARLPFLHIMDGFRTSHEVNKIVEVNDEDIRHLIDDERVRAHRRRALSPDNPVIRGTAQNPDVYFQAREAGNSFYLATPSIVQQIMDKFAEQTGRRYHLFDYVGATDAERVIIMMGSGCETVEETIRYLNQRGEKVGLLKVRLFRPFAIEPFLAALPTSVQAIAVLDRTKEPGSAGEPLYQDVVTAFHERESQVTVTGERNVVDRSSLSPVTVTNVPLPRIIGGRYGLSSKEFTPAMVKAIFDELKQPRPKNHFTIGILDDVTHTSLPFNPDFSIEPDEVVRAIFWGLGSDGTVSVNKNSIKIIGEETANFAQGYFVYDSKKSGARTISHLRFGPQPIQSTYLISRANFVGVHQFGFLQMYNVLEAAQEGAVFLLNAPYTPDKVWDHLPRPIQAGIIAKKLKFYLIDAYKVAQQLGLGGRINTIMQTCFFALLDQAANHNAVLLSRQEAIDAIKAAIRKSYGKRGEAIVQLNFTAVDTTLANLFEVTVPQAVTSTIELPPIVPLHAPDFVQKVTAPMLAAQGDLLPVSLMPIDGTWPSGTTQFEKRNIAQEVPIWDADLCIQCGKCIFVCPHSVIRAKVADAETLADAPDGFKSSPARWRELPELMYTLQVAVEDCTGCNLCVEICPVKDKRAVGRKAINMAPQLPQREEGRKFWEYFLQLPETPRNDSLQFTNVKNVQLLDPLFEFSGACAGCGETPYLRLMSQLFGDHALIANATGCSSIYGGNLPTTPWTHNAAGRGPAWSNSLFIASLNGASPGGWTTYAHLIEEAGADALELNIYHLATDVNSAGADVEQIYLDIVAEVKKQVSVPISVKLGLILVRLAM